MNTKARKEDDGQIKFYGELPSKFLGTTGNYAGGFHLAGEEVWQQEGFYDVVEPEYNRTLEILSPIYLDEENKIYTYDILPNPDLPTIEIAKTNKIEELKRRGRDKFNETDWYYVRKLRKKELGEDVDIPTQITLQNEALYNLLDKKEVEINKLTDLEAILNYDTSLESNKEEKLEEIQEEVIPEETPEEIPATDDTPKEFKEETPVETPSDAPKEEVVEEVSKEETVTNPEPVVESKVEELVPEVPVETASEPEPISITPEST